MKLILALFGVAAAQVQSPGSPKFGPLSKTVGESLSLTLNTSTINEFRKEQNYEHTKVGGFAFPQPVSVNAEKDGKWIDGVWTYTFVATDEVTKGMFVAFDDFVLPEGSSFFAYTESGEIAGAFTSKNNKKNRQFMIRPLSGKKLTVEYNANGATEKPRISIDIVGQAYKGFGEEKRGPSGWCNVNTACSDADDWRDEINGVTVLMSSFGGYCSGSMINNPAGLPYYLTAYHCRPSSRDLVGFNYQEATCNGNDNSLRIEDTAQGLETLASGSGSDFHLLLVEETIPSSYNAYLNGWNADESSSYTDVTCISHPSIDRKKFTQFYGDVTRSGYISSNGDTHWYVKQWDLGTTEGGSSGSPLFNANKQIIGQLHGGYASCTYNYDDYYGALVKSYPSLEAFLGSGGSMNGAYLY